MVRYKFTISVFFCLFLIGCETPPERELIHHEFNSGIFRITYREPGAPFSDHHMILSYTDSLGKTVFEEETELFNDGKNLTNNNVKIQRVNGSIEFVLIGEEQKPESWKLHPLSGFEKLTKPFARH
ncbi:hypothetical protein Q4Q39_01870 [Flavivirga amylovorans]|uniref:Uncharacterized protein n=1 Tax=Flavivirga amylovorans TaxID=870486 RepID=A0ABT8WXM1_9FLAO|nr:hypothetical protein [Flavivirga amylovorans]MDO5986139.1 hypothetical protein [Flavivirga amylovorans]